MDEIKVLTSETYLVYSIDTWLNSDFQMLIVELPQSHAELIMSAIVATEGIFELGTYVPQKTGYLIYVINRTKKLISDEIIESFVGDII